MHAAVLERIEQIADDEISKVFVPGASSPTGVPTFDPNAYVTRRDRRRMAREGREPGGRRFGRRQKALASSGPAAIGSSGPAAIGPANPPSTLSPSQSRGAQVLRGEVLTPPPGGWGSEPSGRAPASAGASSAGAAAVGPGRSPAGEIGSGSSRGGEVARRGSDVARSGGAAERRAAGEIGSGSSRGGDVARRGSDVARRGGAVERRAAEMASERVGGNPNALPPGRPVNPDARPQGSRAGEIGPAPQRAVGSRSNAPALPPGPNGSGIPQPQRQPAAAAPSNQVGPGRRTLELEGRTRGNPNTVPPRSGAIPMGGGSAGPAARSGIRGGGRAALIGGGAAAALGLGGAAVRRRGAKQAAIAARKRKIAIGAGAGAAGAGLVGLAASRRD